MPNWKVTWFFEGNQVVERGASPLVTWTETWYDKNSSTIDNALRNAVRRPFGYAGRRLTFMPDIYRITHVRVSNADNPRDSKFSQISGYTGMIPHTLANRAAAQVTCCLLVNMTVLPLVAGDITHHRMFLIRGLPNTMINGNELRREAVAFRDCMAFLRWLSFEETPVEAAAPLGVPNLAANFSNFYGLRYAGQASTVKPITALSVGTSQRDISVTADLAAVVGDKVSVTGVTFPRGVNRVWTVKNVTVPGTYVLGRSRTRLAGTWDANTGTAKKITYQIESPVQFTIVGLRTRQTGKTVFQGPVGRRSRG